MSITRLTTNGLTGTKYDTVSADNYYMEPIATTLLTGTASSIDFNNIPQGYKHLQLRILQRSTTPNNTNMRFNGDTGSNYNWHELVGDGASATAGSAGSAVTFMKASYLQSVTTGYVGTAVLDILDYSNVYKFKTMRGLVGSDANGSGYIVLRSGLWMNTAAITSLSILPASGSLDTNMRVSLYGIKG